MWITFVILSLALLGTGHTEDLGWDDELVYEDTHNGGDLHTAKVLKFAREVSRKPELKALWDEAVADSKNPSIMYDPQLPDFLCDTSVQYPPATTVHTLRPSDISVMATMGDSITAGNGLGAERLLAVLWEMRGESWSIGADFSLEENVITLANVFRKYNPDLKGPSICVSQYTNAKKSWLNAAEPGGDSSDMPYQAQLIVDRCMADERIDVINDWKFVTLLIGGNDFCGSCDFDEPDFIDPGHTPDVFKQRIQEALDIFHNQLPRTIVHLVPMFDITPLNLFNDTLCTLSHWLFCDCVIVNATAMKPLQMAYFDAMMDLSTSGRYDDRDDFTVVTQTMFAEATLPVDENGDPVRSFLSPDCFHPGRGAHQAFAHVVWNTMFYPVGEKPYDIDDFETNPGWHCPTAEAPYIYTSQNSLPLQSKNKRTETSGKQENAVNKN